MSERITLATMLFGLVLASELAPPARGDHPARPAPAEAGKPDPAAKQNTLVGVVEFDEGKLARITARVRSRIEKLYAKSPGERVKGGEPLAELYSPELVVTAQNLLDAQRSGNPELQRQARDRLRLWGIEDDQIDQVLKTGKVSIRLTVSSPVEGHVIRKYQVEGATVEEGARLFDVADLSTVWVEAPVQDESDLTPLKEGLPVRATAKAFPERQFSGKVAVVAYRDPDTRTLRVRFAVENPRLELRPGMHATVMLARAELNSEPAKTKLRELLKERLATLKKIVTLTTEDYLTGKASFQQVHQATQALLNAELELCESDKERITILEKLLTQAKTHEESAVQLFKSGKAPQSDVLLATVGRLEAEIALERAKSKGSAQSK